jgi:hypothetical protein
MPMTLGENMLLPELPDALIVRRNAHGFSYSFTALQMDKYGRDCAEAAQAEVARLTAELGDLPQAQAEMLSEIKALRTKNSNLRHDGNERAMLQIADKYAHRMAMLLECIVMSVPSGTAYWDEAMATLDGYRGEMNAIHEQGSPTHMGEPVLRHNAEMTGAVRVDCPVIGL